MKNIIESINIIKEDMKEKIKINKERLNEINEKLKIAILKKENLINLNKEDDLDEITFEIDKYKLTIELLNQEIKSFEKVIKDSNKLNIMK